MKKYRNMKKCVAKRIMASMICLSMVMGMPTGISTVCATQESLQVDNTSQSLATADTTNTDPNGTLGKNSDVGITVTKSITGKAGKTVKVAFSLKSSDAASVKLKGVYPVIDAAFPFETSGDAYKIVSAGTDLEKQVTLEAEFKMQARSDLETGYHSVRFIGEYSKTKSDGTTEDYYVIKTINIYFEGIGSTTGNNTGNNTDNDPVDTGDDEPGDFDSGDNDYGGNDYSSSDDSGDSGDATAPKLIISGFDTKPEKIMAGEEFTLTIHIQNTSKTTSVCNGKFLVGNEAGSFLPTSGSSAVYVESIPAGKTGDIELKMKTSADLAQKNYVLVVKGDYDDGKGHDFTYSDNLYVPVYQQVKLGVTDVSMTPESIGIDSEGTLMFTVANQGSAGVYNVNVSVKDDAVSAEESYVGNIAASSSAYATLNVVGVQDNSDTGMINIVISYEDSEGNTGTIEESVACLVGEDAPMGEFGEDEFEGEEEFDDSGIPIWLIIVLVVLVLGAIAGVIIVLVIKKKKKMAALLEEEDGEDDLTDEDF